MDGWLRCAFIRLFVCVLTLPWCLLCGHMPMECVDVDECVFFVAWGGWGFELSCLCVHFGVCVPCSICQCRVQG